MVAPFADCQRTCSAPGMVPAAHMTTVWSVETLWTAPMTCASVGRWFVAPAGGEAVTFFTASYQLVREPASNSPDL